jgi:hypothetical protein
VPPQTFETAIAYTDHFLLLVEQTVYFKKMLIIQQIKQLKRLRVIFIKLPILQQANACRQFHRMKIVHEDVRVEWLHDDCVKAKFELIQFQMSVNEDR